MHCGLKIYAFAPGIGVGRRYAAGEGRVVELLPA